MKVETYEVEELKGSEATTMAADSEALELAKSMGLEGQIKLSDPETDTRCPYQKMSRIQQLVFGALFPQRTRVERYDSGPIPLRVLQVLAHCKELPMFTRFEVWHPMDAREPDPVLVAHTRGEYDGENATFLLARWGESLAAFEKLVGKAKAAWIADRKLKIANALREVEGYMASIENEAEIAFSTGKTDTHAIYI